MNFKKHAEMLLCIHRGSRFNKESFTQFLELFFPEDALKVSPNSGSYDFHDSVDKFLTWSETFYTCVYGKLNTAVRARSLHSLSKITSLSSTFKDSIPDGFVIAEFGSRKYELIPKEDAIGIQYASIFNFEKAYIHKDDESRLVEIVDNDVIISLLEEDINTVDVISISGEIESVHNLPYSTNNIIRNYEGTAYVSKQAAFANGNVSVFKMLAGCIDFDNSYICKAENPDCYTLECDTKVLCEYSEPPVGLRVDGTHFYYAYNRIVYAFPNGYTIDDSGLYRQKPLYLLPYNSFDHPDYSNNAIFKFGVEVEKEDMEILESIDIHSFIDKTNRWVKECDTSLNDNGFELISPIYDLFNLSEFKNSLQKRLLIDHLCADYTSNCGCHITISSGEMSALELYSGLKSFFPLLYSLYPSRCNGYYSKATCLFKGGESPTKYSGIYIKNSELLEFRIFPAVRDAENLLWRVKLIQILLKNIGIGEMSILKMILDKRSELNIHLRTMYKKSGKAQSKILSLATRFINNARLYNHVVLDASILNNVKLKPRK